MIIGFCTTGNVAAFDNKTTHRQLTKVAIEGSEFKANGYLENNINLSNGTETALKSLSVERWLIDGSTFEDEPRCRASNHFHNPLRDWTESGMRDESWFIDWWCSESEYPPENIKSAVHWATGYLEPAPNGAKADAGNQWDWDHAREYFYMYLTGKDYEGAIVATTEEQREEYFAKCFQSLGQVLHLVQDMAVPAHVRDDFRSHLDWVGITWQTLFSPKKWFGDKFEYFVAHHSEWIAGSEGGDLIDGTLTKFWDANTYTGQDPDSIDAQMIGLAEFTNMNFASRNSIFSEDFLTDSDPENDVYYHPYPRKSSTNVQEYIDGTLVPEDVIGEDNELDKIPYIKKTGDGVILNHFVRPTYFTREIQQQPGYDERTFNRSFRIDEECAKEYASQILPRAVGYSAALLDYFFRGEMGVACLPIFFDNGIYALRVKIMNKTATQETMSNATFSLVCRYTPTGGSPDGSDDIFVQCPDVACGTLQYADEYEALFYLTQPIPIENYQSVRCMLAFQGSLGNESGAVAGKSFTLDQEIKFNEEWDNGLYGNYPWTHTTADDNPPNGSTSNTIEDGILIKENIRYAGYETPRYNDSFLYIPGPGVAITPYTYLQYKIDQLSINEVPPAPEGYTAHWQVLILYFNDGALKLQFSIDDQWVDLGWPNVGYYPFTPEAIMLDNIHQLFMNYGIEIPEPLYLNRIGFGQQLWELEDPSTVQQIQTMRVDFIRVIEEKQEEEQ